MAHDTETSDQDVAECPACEGYGYHEVTRHVTRDMAIDAGDRSMEGMPLTERDTCSECGGSGEVPLQDDDCDPLAE